MDSSKGSEGSQSRTPSSSQACAACASCRAVATRAAVTGALGGLVTGITYGIFQEKMFVFRNVVKDYHLREPPIRLFSVLHRGITTVPVAAAFLGVYSGTRCLWQHHIEPSHPVYAGFAGSAAGAVRTVMGEVALHPLIHLQKSLSTGFFAAGMLFIVQFCEGERQREMETRRQRHASLGWGEEMAGGGGEDEATGEL